MLPPFTLHHLALVPGELTCLAWSPPLTCRAAGTDAGICIEILGSLATSGKKTLIDMSKDTFERAQMDEFKITCRELGALRALRVTHDGKVG